MGNIYLNKKDRDALIGIKNKLRDANDVVVIDRLLEQEDSRRLHFNEVSSVYKRTKRAENKFFARSKKEIEKVQNKKGHIRFMKANNKKTGYVQVINDKSEIVGS